MRKVVRTICVAHWKRLSGVAFYAERADDTQLVEAHFVQQECRLDGEHSFMREDQTTATEFDMFWQQAI